MAPTTAIETVIMVRPLKVIAFVCGLISVTLVVVSVASTAWLEAEDYRQGLWDECFTQDNGDLDCRTNEETDWIIACGALCIIALLVDLASTILCAVGLSTNNIKYKFKFYRVSMYLMFLAVLTMVIALIVFPVMFMKELPDRGKSQWYFGWAYGVAWGATIFMFGASVLLLVDKESEEIFYREKTYYPDQETEA